MYHSSPRRLKKSKYGPSGNFDTNDPRLYPLDSRVLEMMGLKKPPRLKFGQAIIFNPFVLHGNIPFQSGFARIACNVRFQSCNKPLLQKNTDYLKYFRLS